MPVEKPWLKGEPYYCKACGLGGGEAMACEDGGCEMESVADAVARRDAAIDAARGSEGEKNE